MSSGRLFLDRVARQQSPSPLHRQPDHITVDRSEGRNYHPTATASFPRVSPKGFTPRSALICVHLRPNLPSQRGAAGLRASVPVDAHRDEHAYTTKNYLPNVLSRYCSTGRHFARVDPQKKLTPNMSNPQSTRGLEQTYGQDVKKQQQRSAAGTRS
jgi:hypothetical protein